MIRIIAPIHTRIFANISAAIALVLFISACTGGALAPGLTARMDQGGATLDRLEAINIINQYRTVRGAAPLMLDNSLNGLAQQLASNYATTSNRPSKPEGSIVQMQLSAGYATFADVFSGWRASATDAAAIADPKATIAGLAVAYSPNSTFGVHWVLLLGAPEEMVSAELANQ